jgi:hypothetical protein
MLGFPLVKIIGIGSAIIIVALAAALFFQNLKLEGVKSERDKLAQWQSDVIDTTSVVADIRDDNGVISKLSLDQVDDQIIMLGQGITKLRAAIVDQNSDVKAREMLLAAQRRQADGDAARLDRLAGQSASRIRRLLDMAEQTPDGACIADPALLKDLEGL